MKYFSLLILPDVQNHFWTRFALKKELKERPLQLVTRYYSFFQCLFLKIIFNIKIKFLELYIIVNSARAFRSSYLVFRSKKTKKT